MSETATKQAVVRMKDRLATIPQTEDEHAERRQLIEIHQRRSGIRRGLTSDIIEAEVARVLAKYDAEVLKLSSAAQEGRC